MGRTTSVVGRSVDLVHPPETVFAAVNDPVIAPLIDPAVRRWEPDRTPIGVGTRFAIRGWFQWLPVRGVSRVVAWDPPHLARYDSVRPRWPIALTAEHRFEPLPDGGTRYTWESTIQHPGPLGRLAVRLAGPLLDRTVADQHRTLAAWLDAHPDRPAWPAR